MILGASGMLGHKMFQVLSGKLDSVQGTIRGTKSDKRFKGTEIFQSTAILDQVDASETGSVLDILRKHRPQVVVNCIGTIKQRSAAQDPITSIRINALLPHEIAAVLSEWDGRLIHFSTDCVFSGETGEYGEEDLSDAHDLYGKTKYLGEGIGGNSLVLRTSIIGRELAHHQSLLDWFLLGAEQSVRGFTRAWWSGVTTNHLASLVGEIVCKNGYLKGLYHVSSGRISKYELLCRLNAAFDLGKEIVPDDSFTCDRSLRGDKLRAAIGYVCPSWDVLLAELTEDRTPYER